MGRPRFINDGRKKAVYMPGGMLEQVTNIADERQRSFSYVVQQAIQFWIDHSYPDVRVDTREGHNK